MKNKENKDQDVRARLQRLEDIEAIKQLKGRYCLHVDVRNENEWVALFTEDAVWDGGTFGRYDGRDAIRKFFQSIPEILSFALHYATNPIIEVNGDEARGHWHLLEPCTSAPGEEAVWGAALYEEKYVREGSRWKFKEVKLMPSFWSPYDQGWAKKRFV